MNPGAAHTTPSGAPLRLIELRERCEAQMDLSVCSGCTACGLRCASDVPMTFAEWKSVQDHVSRLGDVERAHVDRVERQNKTVALGDGVEVQMCRHWDMDTSRCTIYPARPLVCRLLGHVEWMPCPIEKVTQIVRTEDALQLMAAYSEVERRTFDGWDEPA